MRIRRFTTLDELAPYADDWDRLAAGVPFCGSTWLWHWWRHYGPQDDADRSRTCLAVLGVFNDADVLMGIAPWYVDRSVVHAHQDAPQCCGHWAPARFAPTI